MCFNWYDNCCRNRCNGFPSGQRGPMGPQGPAGRDGRMLVNSYTDVIATTLVPSNAIALNDDIITNPSIIHTAGSAALTLPAGIYWISYNAVASASQTGMIGLTLYQNGTAVTKSATAVSLQTANTNVTLSSSFLLNVTDNTVISLQNTSTMPGVIFNPLNLIISRVGNTN